MRHVQENAPRLIAFLPDHGDFFRRLNEIDRLHAMEQKAGYADRPAARLPGESGASGEDALVALAQLLPRPGLQYRIAEIGDGKRRLSALDSSAWRIVGKQVDDERMSRIVGDGTGATHGRLEAARDRNPTYYAV